MSPPVDLTAPPSPAGNRKRRQKARAQAVDARTRIADAAVEVVGRKGFDATTVSDVIELAGVSRKTFYEHFDDKRGCFLMAGERECDRWLEAARAAAERCESGPERLQSVLQAIFEAALDRPAALRMLVFETASMRPDGVKLRTRLLGGWASLLLEALRATGEKAPPAQRTLEILLGGALRVLDARLGGAVRPRKPRRTMILGVVPQLAEWIECYSGAAVPPEHIENGAPGILLGGRAPGTLATASKSSVRRGLPRGENPISRSFVVHSQRERILDAVANLTAAKGYASVTIPDIAQEAAISVQAFYEHFTGKEDTLLVAYEVGHRRALAAVERAYDSETDWPNAVHAALVALLCFLASEPSFAALTLIDVGTASERAMTLSNEGMAGYVGMIAPGFAESKPEYEPPKVAPEAIVGALRELLYGCAIADRARDMHHLVVEATWIVLAPFLGTAAALEIALGAARTPTRGNGKSNGKSNGNGAAANGNGGSARRGRRSAKAADLARGNGGKPRRSARAQ